MKSELSLANFDMYSKKICFFYNNHERMSSYYGFFLTLVYIFASLILFLYEIVKALQRKELKVYDTTIYAQEMPIIDIDINQFYFAFGLEYPRSAIRYIDETIYTAKITFFDKQKKNDDFVTVVEKDLDFEKCNVDNFGKEYQNLFVKDELNNSYCLKDFNYSLTLAGSYKYERITYIRIIVNPCVNSTENNYTCKPQEVIDNRINSGYFSIVLKDFGLNPSNFSSPRIPTLQDLYTTVDKRLSKNYILNFGVTEIHTDTGIINDNIQKGKYLQFRKVLETFSLIEEEDYDKGKNMILAQIRLEDTLFIQKRAYLKLSEIFSRIGGYMQLMNTVFLLITSIINRIYSEIKIINSIFNFNLKENKMALKFKTLKESSKILNQKNARTLGLSSNRLSRENIRQTELDNKTKNNLILKDNDVINFTSLNYSDNKKFNESKNYSIKGNYNKNSFENSKIQNSKIEEQSKNLNIRRESFHKSFYSEIYNKVYNNMEFYDKIDFGIFDFFCCWKNSRKYNHIKLFNEGNNLYRKQMDIVHVFTLLLILEDIIKR